VFSLQFGYRHNYHQSSEITLPVTLRVPDREVTLLAKVDTGAANCIFQREYGEGSLDLTIEEGIKTKFSSAGGPFYAYAHPITLCVFDFSLDITAYFAGDHGFPRNVLGRSGWFQRIRFGLVEHDTELYASLYDDV